MFVNLCPHDLLFVRKDGEVTLPASGIVARVGTNAVVTRHIGGMDVRVITTSAVAGLPDPDGTSIFVVSGMVLEALKGAGCTRPDVVAPATGPQDGAIRNEAGLVVGVTKINGLV